jgi:hypothetical protein
VPDVPHLEVGVETARFDTDPEARIDRLFALVRWVYEATDDTPTVVYGLDPNHVQSILDGMIGFPVTTAGLDDGAGLLLVHTTPTMGVAGANTTPIPSVR